MDLNHQQLAAVTAPLDQDALVLAGAGTGKTRVLTARAQHLVANGVSPQAILMLTFTRKAAAEMTARVRLGGGAAPTVGTFHAYAMNLLRRMPDVFGSKTAVILDSDDQESLMRLVRGEDESIDDRFPKARALLQLHGYARNACISIEAYLDRFAEIPIEQHDQVIAMIARYEERKRESGYLDFEDILVRVAEALEQNAKFRNYLARGFAHILVDEFQDTNPLQWRILERLRDPAKLFVVGDDAQSIYAFRGADVRNIREFQARLPGAQRYPLEINYRSTQPILDLANWALDQSPLVYGKHLEAATEHPYASLPKLIEFHTASAEAAWVATEIDGIERAGYEYTDIVVLVRSAFAARPLERELTRRRIPYELIGGVSLLNSAHVRDVLSLLRAAISRHDELAWTRYLKCWPKVGDKTAVKAVRMVEASLDLRMAIDQWPPALRKQPLAGEGVILTVEAVKQGAAAAISVAVEVLKPVLELKYDNWDRRSRDLEDLIKLAEESGSLQDFMDNCVLDPQGDDRDEGKLRIMTVHAAKGLEAPFVFLFQAHPKAFPHSRSETDEDIEEERRILYVALTRAKTNLAVTFSPPEGGTISWTEYERFFLAEVPSDLVDQDSGAY